MNEITLKSRVSAVLGLPSDASEDRVVEETKRLVKALAAGDALSEHDRQVRDIVRDTNCTPAMAEFILSERRREAEYPPKRL